MKYSVSILIGIVLGLSLGFFIFKNSTEASVEPETIVVEKVKTKVVKETVEVFKKAPSNTTDSLSSTLADSTLANSMDSIKTYEFMSFEEDMNDTLEEVILTEKLMAQRNVTLIRQKTDSTEVGELLGLKGNAFSDVINVEFWDSPLNLTGYSLTRGTLRLFGFNPDEHFQLLEGGEKNQLIYDSETLSIVLPKTNQFKTLKLR